LALTKAHRTALQISMAVAMVDYLALMMWLDLEMARSMETMVSMVVVRVHYLALLIEMAIVKAHQMAASIQMAVDLVHSMAAQILKEPYSVQKTSTEQGRAAHLADLRVWKLEKN